MNTTRVGACERYLDFAAFHNESCVADSIVGVLKRYLELINADNETKEEAVLLYSLTYSVPSTVVILEKRKEFASSIEDFYNKYKYKLVFQSDRKHVRDTNSFVRAYEDFRSKGVFLRLRWKDEIDLNSDTAEIEKCYYFARFSAFLFLEAYSVVFDKKLVGSKIDWRKGDTVTSGMFNVMGQDKLADEWDKHRLHNIDTASLDKGFERLLSIVKIGANPSVVETNLCAYRKLFKGSRYLGYYSDRVLGEIYKEMEEFPECKRLNLLFTARKDTIPSKYLGELNGWTGIRKELKKLFEKTGSWKW